MLTIPRDVARKLRYYVYLYADPRSARPFYVGKGKGARALVHLDAYGPSRKARTLRSLRRAKIEPRIDVLAHGLKDEETAFRIEAAVIDALGPGGLANEMRGWRSLELGRMPLRDLVTHYRAKPVTVVHPALVIRINQLYRYGMSGREMYEATRGVWRVDPRRAGRARYAFAVFEGVVRAVYEVRGWHPAGSTVYRTRTPDDVDVPGRWEFVGHPAPAALQRRYLGRSVSRYLPLGSRSPIRYVRC